MTWHKAPDVEVLEEPRAVSDMERSFLPALKETADYLKAVLFNFRAHSRFADPLDCLTLFLHRP